MDVNVYQAANISVTQNYFISKREFMKICFEAQSKSHSKSIFAYLSNCIFYFDYNFYWKPKNYTNFKSKLNYLDDVEIIGI